RDAVLEDVDLFLRLEVTLLALRGRARVLVLLLQLADVALLRFEVALLPVVLRGRRGLRRRRRRGLDLRRLAVGRRALGIVRDALFVHPLEYRPKRGRAEEGEREDEP